MQILPAAFIIQEKYIVGQFLTCLIYYILIINNWNEKINKNDGMLDMNLI